MTTLTDDDFRAALRGAGIGRTADQLDARACSPDVFGRCVRHEDPRIRYLGLTLLTERLTSGPVPDDAESAGFAALLPGTPAGPPEAALVLAGLYERLGPYLGGRPWPLWRAAQLPARVRIAWLRAELLNDPAVIRRESPGETVYQAVQGAAVTDAHRPGQLVDALVDSGDPVLTAAALRLARQGLRAGLLAPALVREQVVRLLGAGSAEVTTGALKELAEPWAALDPLPAGRLSPYLGSEAANTGPEAAEAALTTAARHGHKHLLWRVVDDPGLSPGLRRRAMELLGDLAERGDIAGLAASAARDPLLFAGPAVTCLRGLHRRGHFPTAADVPVIVGLALADHSIAAHEVATILFTCRRTMADVLLEQEPEPGRELVHRPEEAGHGVPDSAPAADPNRPRRLDLLVALAEQGSGNEEAPSEGARIGEAITRLLPAAPEPGPLLDAIRRLRHTDAEDTVIALLPSAPADALDALEAIGGHRTVTALRAGLGLTAEESTGAIAPHLRAVRDRALELLWLLTDDPEQRRDLLGRLDAAGLPRRVASDLGGPDERELALLSSHLDPDEPVAALCRLAAHGGAGTLPVLADLLLRVVADLAAEDAGGGAARPVRDRPAGSEPVVPAEVFTALHALGNRLHDRGRIRPPCLLDAATAGEAGDALVASTVLDLLDRPGVSDAERSILLELLLRAPYPRTRRRVHRLLRNRDPRVRKHVIALLARDTTGDDAEALSASLIALTATRDVQDIPAVRQALLALGHARARWAAAAVAACLDHPNMNIKKTAAGALVLAGTPAAVPNLLYWLGHHDNPGLRAALAGALRAILGDAYAATVLSAAEHTDEHTGEHADAHDSGHRGAGRARGLLLEGLDGELSASSVLALENQASPVAPALLSLVAAGRVRLTAGTVDDLAPAMTRHGIVVLPGGGPAEDGQPDDDVRSLTSRGWDPAVAARIARRPEPPAAGQLTLLRPLLADWLRLAAAEPVVRGPVVRLVLRLCPSPWTDDELTLLSRSTAALLGELAYAPAGGHATERDGLLAVLEAVAPQLSAVGASVLADAVRALPPAPAGDRSTLTLLRRCGAVLVRADLDRALASARLGADAWRAESTVLRDAFAVPHSPAPAGTKAGTLAGTGTSAGAAGGAAAWRDTLDAAVRAQDTTALEALRHRRDDVPDSRWRLAELVDAYPAAGPAARAALLDWMTDLQPLDAPSWTLAETAGEPVRAPRAVRDADLDQPRSTALRDRLLTLLESADRDHRNTAALALSAWPEPATRLLVLRAFLRGRVTVPVSGAVARLLTGIGPAELRCGEILPGRVALVAGQLDQRDLVPLVPLLLEWWEHGPPELRPTARGLLRRGPADALAEYLTDRLDAGAWGFLDLLTGRPLLRTPALERIRRRLGAEGREDLADGLVLIEGPLRGPGAGSRDAAALVALRTRAQDTPGGAAPRPSRDELISAARTGAPEQIRRALTRLAAVRAGRDTRQGSHEDAELSDLIGELLHHPRPRIRLHAHRTARSVLDRRTYLQHTTVLLDDPEPNVVRTAVLALSHAHWEPAVPAIAGLLEHAHPVVRKTAAEGLVLMGAPAVPALRYAADHARPDRRSRYTDVLELILAVPEHNR